MTKVRVMIVDDSVVFRSQIKSLLGELSEVEVVCTAANGKIALDRLEQSPIDLVTLDWEMPVMGGREFLQAMREKKHQARVIVFSAVSKKGAEAAFDALSLGASDVVAKPGGNTSSLQEAMEHIRSDLLPKIQQFIPKIRSRSEARKPVAPLKSAPPSPPRSLASQKVNLEIYRPKAVVIASSTGGPMALETVFKQISGPLRVPIFIAQHMPPVFTKSLADRLGRSCGIEAREALNGEPLQNIIYVAPGDYHMALVQNEDSTYIKLSQGPKRNSVRPAADILFESASQIYGRHCMGFVFTGMGMDGADGAEEIKRNGGGVMIQDEASSTVWGMPQAVHQRGAFDKIGDLDSCARILKLVAVSSVLGKVS